MEWAIMLLEENLADAAVVGRPVIANPDLARRWQEDHPLNEIDQATVYTAGYTDYPEAGTGFLTRTNNDGGPSASCGRPAVKK